MARRGLSNTLQHLTASGTVTGNSKGSLLGVAPNETAGWQTAPFAADIAGSNPIELQD